MGTGIVHRYLLFSHGLEILVFASLSYIKEKYHICSQCTGHT